jgi:hypothetical protein
MAVKSKPLFPAKVVFTNTEPSEKIKFNEVTIMVTSRREALATAKTMTAPEEGFHLLGVQVEGHWVE